MTANTPRRHPIARFARDTAGIAAVEFALGSIVFLGLIVGVMEVGRAVYIQDTLEHAAKEGARYAAIHSDSALDPDTDAEIETFAKSKAPGLDQAILQPVVEWTDGCRVAGCRVRVKLIYPFAAAVNNLVPFGNFEMVAASTYTATR